MKVLSVSDGYPPEYGGGASIYVRDVCAAMADRGHDVTTLSCTSSDTRPDFAVVSERQGPVAVDRVMLTALKRHDPEGWSLGSAAWARHEIEVEAFLRHYLGRVEPDVVLYSTTRPLGEAGVLALSAGGAPVVALLHDAWLVCARVMLHRSPTGELCDGPGALRCHDCMYSHYDGRPLALAKLPWRVARIGTYFHDRLRRRKAAWDSVDAAVGYSRFMVRVHGGVGRPRPIRYIPLGVDRSDLPPPVTRPRSPLRFGFFGGTQPTKGLSIVLDAATRVAAAGLPFELHLWGPGIAENAVAIVPEPVRRHVQLRGSYGADDMWTAYAQIDVAIMATLVAEPFGRIPLEAAAAGVPTLAPDVGGIPESIAHGEGGYLFPRADAAALARLMELLVRDSAEYERLRRNLPVVPDTREASEPLEAFLAQVAEGRRSTAPRTA